MSNTLGKIVDRAVIKALLVEITKQEAILAEVIKAMEADPYPYTNPIYQHAVFYEVNGGLHSYTQTSRFLLDMYRDLTGCAESLVDRPQGVFTAEQVKEAVDHCYLADLELFENSRNYGSMTPLQCQEKCNTVSSLRERIYYRLGIWKRED